MREFYEIKREFDQNLDRNRNEDIYTGIVWNGNQKPIPAVLWIAICISCY